VTIARNGAEGWKLFREDPSRFDLVITDQTMPDMTGLTLARKMLGVRERIPILLCTGHGEVVPDGKIEKAGIRALVQKPVMKKELAETVRRALDKKKRS